MNQYWFVKIHPIFKGINEDTGERVEFKNWVETIIDVYSDTLQNAKRVAALTGFVEDVHYNDVLIKMGEVDY